MGVYINMEIPTARDTLVLVKTDGTAIVYEDEAYVTTAVPVPEHGRLIDADALVLKGYALSVIRSGSYGAWRDDVPLTDTDAAPTVIPASIEERARP